MDKKLFKILILLILFIPNNVYGVTINDLEEKLRYLESLDSNKLSSSELSNLTYEIMDIDIIKNDIKNKIKEKEELINSYQDLLEQKKVETNEYLKFLQLSGLSNAYLEYIFDSNTVTEFIYKYGIIDQLSEYNNNLINDTLELINKLNNDTQELVNKYDELDKQSKLYTEKYNIYRLNNSNNKIEGASIEEDILSLKEKIKYYKSIGCGLYQDINSCENIPLTSLWYYPLEKGCVTSDFTGNKVRSDYEELGGHYGIDLDCGSEGDNVYAASKGVVALLAKYRCGGNTIYIYHNVNGKKYTTVYMHLLEIKVKLGQVVDENTIIGLMGGKSTSTLFGGYDRCSKGEHLHFGVSEGYYISTDEFNDNAIDARNILKFPVVYYDSKEFFYR